MKEISRRRALAAVGTTGALALAGCNAIELGSDEDGEDGEDESDEPVAEEESTDEPADDESPAVAEQPYAFALSPNLFEGYQVRAYDGIQSYLDAELAPTELATPDSQTAIAVGLHDGTFAFAETGTFVGALAARNGDAEIALQRRAYGGWTYAAEIVTREDSDVQSLEYVPGSTVAFADPSSSSGSFVPLHALSEAGVDVGELPQENTDASFDASFSSHAQAVQMVLDGDVDVACVGRFITLADDGERLRNALQSLHTQADIPRAPILTSPALDERSKLTNPANQGITTDEFVDAMLAAPESAYHGEDEEPNTDDDLWFDDLRPTDADAYELPLAVADTLDLTVEDVSDLAR